LLQFQVIASEPSAWIKLNAGMNIDLILDTFNRHGVDYLLLGGMNFLLRHAPITTFDIDLWIEDVPANLRRCEAALAALSAEWGQTDADWGSVAAKPAGWLAQQHVFCLLSPHGFIDVFRSVKGLPVWQLSYQNAVSEQTAQGTSYHGLSDADMLQCQLALDPAHQKLDRIRTLQSLLQQQP
jgi:hypothetical protein